MGINNLLWDSEKVSWKYLTSKIELKLSNINFVNVDQLENHIYIVCGECFAEDEIYYYTFNGERKLSYSKISGKIIWEHDGKLVEIDCKNIVSAKMQKDDKLLWVLTESSSQREKLLVFALNGDLLYELTSPKDYKFVYLSSIDGEPTIVCEGANEDKYGRNRWHFIINKTTGDLEKVSLAY
ncbi:hypothetical protein [Metabacillus litoralis]|uniref:hypothetical protein n=1 Tax=Metabacillus litoralis TaxID=152268 RepID=UPI001CFE3D78|nr:hypothetical protein [Metabacillus litoralis]